MPESIEKIRKHGKILVDFVNTKTSDEACVAYFKNIKDFLSFSTAFDDRMKESFPLVSSFKESMNEPELKILNLIPIERQLLNILNEQFGLVGYRLKGCDPKNKTLSLSRVFVSAGLSHGKVDVDVTEEGPFVIPINKINAELEDFENLNPDITHNINELMETTNNINALKSDIAESRFKELLELSDKYEEILNLHRKIKILQEEYRSLLGMIVEGKPLYDISLVDKLIDIYYKMPTTKLRPGEDFFKQIPPISEHDYLQTEAIEGWGSILQKHIAYCMVQYFIGEQNRKYLRKCNECKSFYVSKSVARSKYCSDKCRLKYHNRKRIESGKHREDKRRKRIEGAKESY